MVNQLPRPSTSPPANSPAIATDPTVPTAATLALLQSAEACAVTGKWQETIALCRQSLRQQPTARGYKLLGNAFLYTGELRGAQVAYERALKLQPDWAEVYANLGTVARQQERWVEALQYYHEAVALKPDLEELTQNLDRLWQEIGGSSRSLQAVVQAFTAEPQRFSAADHVVLGDRCVDLGELDLAVQCYRQAIELDDQSATAYWNLSVVLEKLGDRSGMLAAYRQALLLQPDWGTAEVHCQLGNEFLQQENWQQAIECYQRAVDREGSLAEAHFGLGVALQKVGKLEAAIEAYRRTVQDDVNHWQAHHNLGGVLLELQRWQQAVEAFRKSIELNPEYFWSHQNLGDGLMRLERWEEAVEAYRGAIKLRDDFCWSHYNLGEALSKLERWDEAIEVCRYSLELEPNSALMYRKLGEYFSHQSQPDLSAALDAYQKAIWHDPENLNTYYKALEIAPKSLELYIGLSNALFRRSKSDEALVFLQFATQLLESRNSNTSGLDTLSEISYQSTPQKDKKLALPSSSSPLVSVVIPVYNKIDYTYRCLESLAKYINDSTSVEIIVVNDCSTDETKAVLEQVEGLILINNEQNSGFIRSCNRGAANSSGEFIYFLNNDTEIRLGCIEHLISVLQCDDTIGAVGSKLIYPNGALQEAGGIIWNDASGWNYGRLQNPFDPQYNYLRPVDYCSAASLLVRRSVFEKLGGFEKEFVPAYYEDTDLCFGIRNILGLKVMYQPKSELVHYEGISSGTSTISGVKQYQVVNSVKFKDKWQKELQKHLPNQGHEGVAEASRRYLGDRTILILNPYPPCYDKESGARRLFEIIKLFKQLNYHVIFAPENGHKEEPYVSQLQELQIEVLYTQDGYGISIFQQIRERLPLIDVAWICFPDLTKRYLPLFRENPRIKVIYDTIDLHHLRLKRAWEMMPTPRDIEIAKQWLDMQTMELSAANQADMTITITSIEQEILKNQGIQQVEVIPNIHYPYSGSKPEFTSRSNLLFIGGYNHPPNVDAVVWLCEKIMPIVWQTIPGVHVTLLGSNPTPVVRQLAMRNRNITVTGYVEDVTDYFLSHRVFVAPLRYGAGMKGKVGQSLEYGLPVISTQIGTEGMHVTPGKNVLVADSEQEFATAILRLYQDEQLWNQLAGNARCAIEPYTPETVKANLVRIVEQLL